MTMRVSLARKCKISKMASMTSEKGLGCVTKEDSRSYMIAKKSITNSLDVLLQRLAITCSGRRTFLTTG